ncbi:lipid-A-disaccharide synthase [Thermodesulfatator autotrophicus]|uniref:lipid-A-disaccharide synthase n=1 Tax=Thermodesulfatator autotrophicus TaxID=1795632 RepID=UPI0008397D7E|nr:lipid-A-disaccharide synthase [Thermodesulfatator autotrophicus]
MSSRPHKALRVFLVAGESSGDLHGASLVRALREILPGIHIQGIGGPKLRATGFECLYPAENLAIVGLPSLQEAREVLRVFKRIKKILRESPPNLLILIDFPEFNLRLAKYAKRYQVPVFYFISPQVWAWRTYRVHLIKRVVDKMAVVFPFEVDFYARYGYKVHFVGHPLVDVVKPSLNRETLCRLLGLDSGRPIVGIFPGSRRREVITLLPLFLEAFNLVKKERPDVQGVIVRAEGLSDEFFLGASGLKVVKGYQYDVMAQSEVVLLASGTVTLEATIVGVPMVVAYKLNKLSYWLAKKLVKVPYASLTNLLAGKALVPEHLQNEATPENLAEALLKFLNDHHYNQQVRDKLAQIKASLGPGGAAWRAAELAASLIRERR